MKADTSQSQNIFSDIPSHLPKECLNVLLQTKALRLERIVSEGHTSAKGFWYDQDFSEWVILLEGEAELEFEKPEKLLVLKKGDYVNIPAHRRHRVNKTSKKPQAVWLAVHYLGE